MSRFQRFEDREGCTLIDLPDDDCAEIGASVTYDRQLQEIVDSRTEVTLSGEPVSFDELSVILGSHEAARTAWDEATDVAAFG